MIARLNCTLLLTCDQTILSKDNKISLIGIFDQVFLTEIPGNHPKISLVGIVTGEPFSDHTLTISITDSQGKNLYPNQNISLNLGATGKSHLVAEFTNLPISSAGPISFSLISGKLLLGSTSLTVTKFSPPQKNRVIN